MWRGCQLNGMGELVAARLALVGMPQRAGLCATQVGLTSEKNDADDAGRGAPGW